MIEEILNVVRSMSRRSASKDIISSMIIGQQGTLLDSTGEGGNSTIAISRTAARRLAAIKQGEALRIASSADEKVGLDLPPYYHKPDKSEPDKSDED